MARLIVAGGGGREHALVWKLAQSQQVEHIYALPGNPGCAAEPKTTCVEIDPADQTKLIDFAQAKGVSLVVIGPEAPIADGLADACAGAGLACCAPGRDAARLESSKAWCKELLLESGIPTAAARVFDDYHQARADVQARTRYPLVLKASGLAAGKGVIIARDFAEAEQALASMMLQGKFNQAGRLVVVEDFLQGEELSYIALVDSQTIVPLASSQDYKRLGEGDTGPNTGGMGAYSPAPLCTPDLEQRIAERIVRPTLAALQSRGMSYRGFLYAGLMIDATGEPWLLEYNCRLGDPETQPLMMRLSSDLYPLLLATARGCLADCTPPKWSRQYALGVVLAAPGYPDAPMTGQPIGNLPASGDCLKIFHAGTNCKNGVLLSSGGRVLCVTALAASLTEAQEATLVYANSITMPGKQFRRDIGWRALASTT